MKEVIFLPIMHYLICDFILGGLCIRPFARQRAIIPQLGSQLPPRGGQAQPLLRGGHRRGGGHPSEGGTPAPAKGRARQQPAAGEGPAGSRALKAVLRF